MNILYRAMNLGNPDDPNPARREDWENFMKAILKAQDPDSPVKGRFNTSAMILKVQFKVLCDVYQEMTGGEPGLHVDLPGLVYMNLRKLPANNEEYEGGNGRALVLMAGDSRLEKLAESEAKIPIFEGRGSSRRASGGFSRSPSNTDIDLYGTMADPDELIEYHKDKKADFHKLEAKGLLTLSWLAQPQSRESAVSNLWGFADFNFIENK